MNIIYPKSYVAWDLETSGLDPAHDRILEIGAARVENGEIVERKSWLLQNNIDIPAEVTAIHGITNEIIAAEGRDPRECMEEFLAYLEPGRRPHLTHNGIWFDIPFIAEQAVRILELKMADFEKLRDSLYETAIDTAVIVKAGKIDMARMWNEDFKDWADRVMGTKAFGVKYNVGLCCEEMGIDKTKVTQHRALGDIELTHEIFKRVIPA